MADFAKEVLLVALEDEMRQSYLDYAMSVIVGRALPDVRDGLKPVHRRVLFAMSELGNDWNKSYKKSARIVGDVIGKYHPHGDTAVYDALVRMAQPFSLRYLLIDGQGNFGSVDGDAPAAMRYTEVRMSRIAHELLADIDKETVNFVPNYDETEREPAVLPTRLPNLLVNGSSGIAVGMATNIPPHNLNETIEACVALLEDPGIALEDLIRHLPGPDFPTAGIINGREGIQEAYRTGRGRVYVRSRSHVETDRQGATRIVVTELPYQVNKARLLEKIAELVKGQKIEGISGLRDESDKDGMRMVIEIKRGELPDIVLNNLYQHTQLQSVFGINMVALVDGQPRLLNVKQILQAFLRHRRDVVTRRTIFELRRARERAHVLEGLAVALANLDPIIALIKASASPAAARHELMARAWQPGVVSEMLARAGSDARPEGLALTVGLTAEGYRLSDVQAQAILDLRLHRLTGLEQDRIVADYRELLTQIQALLHILRDPDRLLAVIREELLAVKAQYGDVRRTEIIDTQPDLAREDLVPDEPLVVTLSHAGYAKSQPVADYRAQRRGGRGRMATRVKGEDFIEKLFVANAHDTILCFSNRGKVYWLKAYELPQAGRIARGRPLVNLLPLEAEERISALQAVRTFSDQAYVVMATRQGVIKKTPLTDFSRPRASGIIALELREEDALVGVEITDGNQHLLLVTSAGKIIRFSETEVRAMGRTAAGVRGVRLSEQTRVIALITANADTADAVLLATTKGFGKRTPIGTFPLHGRGGQGVMGIPTTGRNGEVIGAVRVAEDDEVMLMTDAGTLVRLSIAEVSNLGRSAQGVTLIRLSQGERLVEVECVPHLNGAEAVEFEAEGEPSEDMVDAELRRSHEDQSPEGQSPDEGQSSDEGESSTP